LGYIFVLFFACWYVDKKVDLKKSFVLDASRESLLVYWLHLIIIFGTFWGGKSLAMIIGAKLNVLEASGVTVVLIFLMILTAKLWGWIKKTYPKHASILVKVFVGVLVLVFFIS